MSNFKGYVYIHINKVNAKCYVGATTRKPEIRWGKNGKNYTGDFKEAIKFYGWDGFHHLVLPKVYLSQKALNEAERYYMSVLNSIADGYNMNKAGKMNYEAIIAKNRRNGRNKAVVATNLKTDEEFNFDSCHEAARWLSSNYIRHIDPVVLSSKVLDIVNPKVKRNTAYGWTFRYTD